MCPRPDFFGLGLFVRRRDVLQLIEERGKDGDETSYRSLVSELGISPDAAASHLKRLWVERFIKSTSYPSRFSEQLGSGESVRDLRFTLARRGRERLKWFRERDNERDDEE
jgi:hypothetical protein